jgi:hypothetical protein
MPDVPANISTKAVLEGDSGVGTYSGQLEKPGDHDWIKVDDLGFGVPVSFYACFLNFGSLVDGDSTLSIRDATGAEVASNSAAKAPTS